jgi:hopanoid biosynthesis associated protein HpnK
VIFTADDFGLSPAVNAAIERAHRHGVLNTTSLMVSADATVDAVACARRNPDLRVGLHLVVVDGRPVLPSSEIPDLVGPTGRFTTALVRAGFRYFFSPRVRRQLAAEIRAQFDAFRATGLALDHVDAHHHMHLHPSVLRLMLEIGDDYGMRAVRLPIEPPGLAHDPTEPGRFRRVAQTAGLMPWCLGVRRALKRRGIVTADRVVGLHDTGRMTGRRVARALCSLPDGTTELFFHPAVAELEGPWPLTPDDCAAELEALLDPRVSEALVTQGIVRTSFGELAAAA